MQCPTCLRHDYIRNVVEKDPKTRKFWRITRCTACGHNFDLEEVLKTRAITPDPDYEDR